jgi:hypothetical protein
VAVFSLQTIWTIQPKSCLSRRSGRVRCASAIENLIVRSDDGSGGTSSTPTSQSSASLVWEHVAFPGLCLRIDSLPHQRRSSTRPIAFASRSALADRCPLTSFPASVLPSRAMAPSWIGRGLRSIPTISIRAFPYTWPTMRSPGAGSFCVDHALVFARWAGGAPGAFGPERVVFDGTTVRSFSASDDDEILISAATVRGLGSYPAVLSHLAAAELEIPPLRIDGSV